MCVPTTTATTTAMMRGIGFLDLGLDADFFPLATTATAWETVKRKVKDAQRRGFMS